jgi:hypothetical protein
MAGVEDSADAIKTIPLAPLGRGDRIKGGNYCFHSCSQSPPSQGGFRGIPVPGGDANELSDVDPLFRCIFTTDSIAPCLYEFGFAFLFPEEEAGGDGDDACLDGEVWDRGF